MGAPLSDAERLYDWSNWIQKQFAQDVLSERPQIEQAVLEFYEYAHGLLDARRADPGDDLISLLIAAEEDGDRLSDDELVNLVLNILVGGVDTTQSQLAHAMKLFAEHPDQWQLLAADPEHVRRARGVGGAALRADHAVHRADRARGHRVPRRDVPRGHDRDGVGVRREPRPATDWDEPDEFDITAERGVKPHTFGAGIHYCVGANLARLELTEALTFLSAADARPAPGRRARLRQRQRHLRTRRAAARVPAGRVRSLWRPTPAQLTRVVFGLTIFGIGDGLVTWSELGNVPGRCSPRACRCRRRSRSAPPRCVIGVAVLLAWIPLRERPGLGTVLNVLIISLMIDVTLWVMPESDALSARWPALIGGIALVGVGSGFYLTSMLGPGPRDGLMTGIHARTGWPIFAVRTGIEASAVAIGWVLGGTVGAGSVLFAVLVGPAVATALRFTPPMREPAAAPSPTA